MKIKHQDIEIPVENPFANCKLKREKYADVLTNIVKTYADGFVLAINNEWGAGKTTFVKMWQQQLKNNQYRTIYFNAWENDFDSNPLIAVMSELKELTNSKNQEIFKSVLEKGSILVKNALPAIGKSILSKYIKIDDVKNILEEATKGLAEILDKEVQEYANKKQSIVDFRKQIEKFIKSTGEEKPIVFIIDELDRCRPDYAIEVLEQLKHFFSVEGIVFVLSIDKNQLLHSICGYYGNTNFNSREYLRRFIDLEYSLPKPSVESFCKYLYQYYSFDDFFLSSYRTGWKFPTGDELLASAEILFNSVEANLRQQEKIFGLTRLVISFFRHDESTFTYLLFFLIFLKSFYPEFYKKIEDSSLSLQELADRFSSVIKPNDENVSTFSYILAALILIYSNSREANNTDKLFSIVKGEEIINVTSALKNDNRFHSLIRTFNNNEAFRGKRINYLLDRINLTDNASI